MHTHNIERENSIDSLKDCLKVIKHIRSTGVAVSLQTDHYKKFLEMGLNNV